MGADSESVQARLAAETRFRFPEAASVFLAWDGKPEAWAEVLDSNGRLLGTLTREETLELFEKAINRGIKPR